MNERIIRELFPNASRSLIAANADGAELSGDRPEKPKDAQSAVCPQLEPGAERRALRAGQAQAEDSGRLFVRVTSVRSRLIDEDNLCEKYIVDCCRYAGLLPGDGPGQTKIEATQRKAAKGEEEHTVVEIFEQPMKRILDALEAES